MDNIRISKYKKTGFSTCLKNFAKLVLLNILILSVLVCSGIKVNLGGPQADPMILTEKKFICQNPLLLLVFTVRNPSHNIYISTICSVRMSERMRFCQSPLYGQTDPVIYLGEPPPTIRLTLTGELVAVKHV